MEEVVEVMEEEVVEEEAAPLAEATLVVAAVPLTPPRSVPWLAPP